MKIMFIFLLLSSGLVAMETVEGGFGIREFYITNGVITEIRVDDKNPKGDDLKLCEDVVKMAKSTGKDIVDFRIFYDNLSNTLPVNFNASFKEEYHPSVCCVNGYIKNKDGKYKVGITDIHYDHLDTDLIYISHTAKVTREKWHYKYADGPYAILSFIEDNKISDFKTAEDGVYYKAKTTEVEVVSFKKEPYWMSEKNWMASQKPLRVWSEKAAKIFGIYSKNNDFVCSNIIGMHIYRNWLVVHTDCSSINNPGPMSDYFMKRIDRKWVLVYDDNIMSDPRYKGKIWIPTKEDEKQPGIGWFDIPEKLKGL